MVTLLRKVALFTSSDVHVLKQFCLTGLCHSKRIIAMRCLSVWFLGYWFGKYYYYQYVCMFCTVPVCYVFFEFSVPNSTLKCIYYRCIRKKEINSFKQHTGSVYASLFSVSFFLRYSRLMSPIKITGISLGFMLRDRFFE